MVAGHLQEKKGYFYMVLSYPDAAGKRKTKWLPTGLPVKGNKKKAEKMLMETRQTFVPECKPIQDDMLFSDFLLQWLEIAKPTIALTTYASYSGMAKSVIIPYFKEREITLSEMKATDIQAFYMKQLKRVKANSVIHYHAVIHRALKYAVKIDLISVNPADKVERPKADKFIGSFYDSNEVQALFEAAKGTLIEIPIFLGAFYGLRRSEALGLKWDAIDFQNNTITIRHTVTSCNLDGKMQEGEEAGQAGADALPAPSLAVVFPSQLHGSVVLKQREKAARDLFSKDVYKVRHPIESFFNKLNEKTEIQRASKVRAIKGLLVHTFGKLDIALLSYVNF